MPKLSRPLSNALPKTSRSRLLPIAAVILATTVCLGLAARVLPESDYVIPYPNWFVTLIPESWNNMVSTNVASADQETRRPAAQTLSTQSAAVIPEPAGVFLDASAPRSIMSADAVSTSSQFSFAGTASTRPSGGALLHPGN